MHDTFDQETGEVDTPSVAERAMEAARTERRDRREDSKGVGLVSIYAKLAIAYKKIAPVIGKDASSNRGKFTSYKRVVELVRPPLLEQGVLIRHGAERVFSMSEGTSKTYWVPIFTDLIDTQTGDVVRTEMPMPIARPDPQAMGIAMSYGKRYTLLAALGIATGDPTEDDDADSAMPRDVDGERPGDPFIRACKETKTLEAYQKWRTAADRGLNGLTEDEFERVKVEAMKHREVLANADDTPAEKPKRSSGKREAE